MRSRLELPQLSRQERDRRWAEVRRVMGERNLDCLLLCGFPSHWDFTVANARFLTQIGGNAAFNFVVFPRDGEPTCFELMPTFLEYWKRAQDWVSDVRARRGGWADTVVSRLRELGFENGTIGVDGLAGPLDPDGWFPHSVYARVRELLPGASFVDTEDMLEKIRSEKSPEEIGMLERAAGLGDRMLEACARTARPGVRECEVYAAMMEAMLAGGGEEPTLFLWAADAAPLPHPFRLPTQRPLEERDLIICEMHPKYGGYFTHLERTFCLGEPAPQYRNIYEGCLAAYRRGLDGFTAGAKISAALDAVKEVVDARRLDFCELGIHGHGLSSLEYPRCRQHARRSDDRALAAIGDEFRPGMVFAFNIDLVDPRWQEGRTGCVFAETLVVTETGPRPLHSYPTDFQILG